MDYKVLTDKYFLGMTSCEEEAELRRCLMQDNLPADMLQERDCLLAMLNPVEYECSEAMDAVSAMIDNFAAVETVTMQQRKVSRRIVLHSLGSVVAVAAAALLFFLFFPYSNETVQDDKELLATACVNENGAYESVIENDYVNSVAQNQVAVDEIQPVAVEKEVHLYSRLDETAVHKITENRVESEAATCERFIGNILSEPSVVPSSVAAIVNSEKNAALYLLNLYSIMEYLRYMHGNDASSNFAYIAKSVGMMATGRPHAPHIEKLIDSKAGSGSFDAIWQLEENSIEFAPDDVPWNPATPLRVYRIQSKNRETIVTFLYSICFDSQYVGLSSRAYAVDDGSGNVYDVIGYTKGIPMDKRLVVNGCKGRNILISLRFPKFKRRVKSITIHDPEQKSSVLQICDFPVSTAIVSGVNVKKFKK